MKAAFRRVRPDYVRQSTFYCLPGEWFSFPSGHTMRAAFLARRLLGDGPGPWSYVLLVAWARVARGKHFPLDVAGGLAGGLALAAAADALGAREWAALKYCAGAVLTFEAAAVLAVPRWRLAGSGVHVGINLLWLLSLRYGEGPSAADLAARCAGWLPWPSRTGA